ncbi:hypothetical protein ACHAWF_004347 [Thalassiosira exigua]
MLVPTKCVAIAAILLPCARIHSLSLVPSRGGSSIVRIGTRSSKLALIQAETFRRTLEESARNNELRTEIVPIDSAGDQGRDAPIQQLPLAMTGVDFTGRLDDAVLNGSVDVAVHSLKDIPPTCRWNGKDEGRSHLVIGAYLGPRATPQDALITKDASIDSIQQLPHEARVGSASMRRQAQLKAIRPDLKVINIRGNVDARLEALKNDEIDALVLALAGLKRLGLVDDDGSSMKYSCSPIPIQTMLPGLGQGIIAVTCRVDKAEVLGLLQGVDDRKSRTAATTERAFLDAVQELSDVPWVGRPPVAGFMRPSDESKQSNKWLFDGLLASPDGARVLRAHDEWDSSSCDDEIAPRIGTNCGKEVVQNMAGKNFWGGYS